MAGLSRGKPVLSGEILRHLDALTDSDLNSSVSDVDYGQK
jgi:hypothetical protein